MLSQQQYVSFWSVKVIWYLWAHAAAQTPTLYWSDYVFVMAGDQHKLLWSEAAAAATTLELQTVVYYWTMMSIIRIQSYFI